MKQLYGWWVGVWMSVQAVGQATACTYPECPRYCQAMADAQAMLAANNLPAVLELYKSARVEASLCHIAEGEIDAGIEAVFHAIEQKKDSLYRIHARLKEQTAHIHKVNSYFNFSEGLAWAYDAQKERFAVLDIEGNVRGGFDYTAPQQFKNHKAIARLGAQWVWVERDGSVQLPAFRDYQRLDNGWYLVEAGQMRYKLWSQQYEPIWEGYGDDIEDTFPCSAGILNGYVLGHNFIIKTQNNTWSSFDIYACDSNIFWYRQVLKNEQAQEKVSDPSQQPEIWRVINNRGEIITAPYFTDVMFWDEDRATKWAKTSEGWGLYEYNLEKKEMRARLTPQWSSILGNWTNETTWVGVGGGDWGKWDGSERLGLINKEGVFLAEPIFMTVLYDDAHKATVSVDGIWNGWGWMEVNIHPYSGKIGQIGTIDTHGDFLVPLHKPAKNWVELEGKWGLYDSLGTEIIPSKFTNPDTWRDTFIWMFEAFSDSLLYEMSSALPTDCRGLYGLYTTTGREIFKPQFLKIDTTLKKNPIFAAASLVGDTVLWGVYDGQGAILCSPKFSSIIKLGENGLLWAAQNGIYTLKTSRYGHDVWENGAEGKIGLWDIFHQRTIFLPQFDGISLGENGICYVGIHGKFKKNTEKIFAPSYYKGKIGILDSLGNWIFEPQFGYVDVMRQDYPLQWVSLEDVGDEQAGVARFGLIDLERKTWVFAPKFSDVKEWQHGDVAWVTIEGMDTENSESTDNAENKYALIHKDGRMLLPPMFKSFGNWHNNLCVGIIDVRYSYASQGGRWEYPIDLAIISNQGRILARWRQDSTNQWQQLPDSTGGNVLSPSLPPILDLYVEDAFPENIWFGISDPGGRKKGGMSNRLWGLMNYQGKEILKPQFSDIPHEDIAFPFSDIPPIAFPCIIEGELLWVYKAGQYHLLDSNMHVFPTTWYQKASLKEAGNGLYWVGIAGAYGLIEPYNQKIWIDPLKGIKYDDVGGCQEGLCAVKSGDRWGFVDMDGGRERIPCVYDDPSGKYNPAKSPIFVGQKAFVSKMGISFYINTKGEMITRP